MKKERLREGGRGGQSRVGGTVGGGEGERNRKKRGGRNMVRWVGLPM